MKKNLNKWFTRYVFPELVAIPAAVVAASLVFTFSHNRLLSGYAGTWGETIGYYAIIFIRDFNSEKHGSQLLKKRRPALRLLENFTGMLTEFGPAEALDSLIIRPFALYFAPLVFANYVIGIIIGKFVADIVFITIVITMYGVRKKVLQKVFRT